MLLLRKSVHPSASPPRGICLDGHVIGTIVPLPAPARKKRFPQFATRYVTYCDMCRRGGDEGHETRAETLAAASARRPYHGRDKRGRSRWWSQCLMSPRRVSGLMSHVRAPTPISPAADSCAATALPSRFANFQCCQFPIGHWPLELDIGNIFTFPRGVTQWWRDMSHPS